MRGKTGAAARQGLDLRPRLSDRRHQRQVAGRISRRLHPVRPARRADRPADVGDRADGAEPDGGQLHRLDDAGRAAGAQAALNCTCHLVRGGVTDRGAVNAASSACLATLGCAALMPGRRSMLRSPELAQVGAPPACKVDSASTAPSIPWSVAAKTLAGKMTTAGAAPLPLECRRADSCRHGGPGERRAFLALECRRADSCW